MNLSTEQKSALQRFAEAYSAYKHAEIELQADLRRRIDEELLIFRLEASRAGNEARDAGVPISRIGAVGMNTRDWKTARDFLDLTSSLLPEAAWKIGNPK